MKKFLLIICMLFFIDGVHAMEYTDYSSFGEFSDKYIQSDDLTDVKVERRYMYYKFVKELGEYGEGSDEYPYIDVDDYIYSEYSPVSLQKPDDFSGRIIEEVSGYHYKKLKDINYIVLKASMADLEIGDISVLYDGDEISYDMETYDFDENVLKRNGYIKFKFDDDLFVSKFKIIYHCLSKSNIDGRLWVEVGNDDAVYGYTTLDFYNTSFDGVWDGLMMPSVESQFEDYYSLDELDCGETVRYRGKVTLYRYKDILYRSYNLNKVYYDDYLTLPYGDYIYRDDSLFKDYYAKRVRSVKNVDNAFDSNNEYVNDDALAFDFSEDSSDDVLILNKTKTSYQIPSKAIYYPIDVDKIEDLKDKDINKIFVFAFLFILLVVFVLVLSKLYQKKRLCAKVR